MSVFSIIIAIFIFCFIIIFHELGHFSFAKLFDVQVNEFTLGFGPTIIGKKVGETLYAWKLLPFGGSCAMEGEDEESDSPRAFGKKTVWQRFLIVFFGPGFNFILAFILALFLIGFSGVDFPEVGYVEPGSPAYEAGIREGDVLKSVNGSTINFYRDFTLHGVTHRGESITLSYEREGEIKSVEMTPVKDETTGKYAFGLTKVAQRKHVGLSLIHI